ncbi:MAG TPA: zf-TFIIB domain-containing protein [Polyangiaceae bacterium]|nr:zf-TFIIB domain-containing protein [Polyangiaceae bacterium]
MASANDAVSYACPNCGAPVAATARACTYCHVALATRRCTHCFDHSAASARHCATCGRELGLEPVAEASELSCPACRNALAALTEAGGTLFDCARCGGHFVEHALFRALIEQRASLAQSSTIAPARSALQTQKVTYRPCARCGALMHRKNFGGTSGVIVDVCPVHGIWFDAGELPEVLTFVERGGLERARQRDEERARRARIEERSAHSKPFTNLESLENGSTKESALVELITNFLLWLV